jgi:hypothetical protein
LGRRKWMAKWALAQSKWEGGSPYDYWDPTAHRQPPNSRNTRCKKNAGKKALIIIYSGRKWAAQVAAGFSSDRWTP